MILIILAVFFTGNSVYAQMPVTVTTDIPGTTIATKNWLESTWVYIRNKMATIFFQNTLRKVLNDFAKDAATYIGAGGKGQQALYIKEKWGNHWADIADAAAGDFVESFANSVVSDAAYNQATKDNNIKLQACQTTWDNCVGKVTAYEQYAVCDKALAACNKKVGDKATDMRACTESYTACQEACADQGPASPACLASCKSISDQCSLNVGGDLEKRRKSAMLGSKSVIGSQFQPLAKLNICNPSLSVSVQIGLGLVISDTAWKPDCTLTEMMNNWATEYDKLKSMADKTFLKTFATYFRPVSSDLSVAFTVYSNQAQYKSDTRIVNEKETIANQGWLDVRNFSGDLLGTPGDAKVRREMTDQAVWDNLGKITQDVLVDAANIFLNQYAITKFQDLMSNLSDNTGNTNLLSFYGGSAGNRQAIESKISKLTEPVFSEPGKMNILADLSTCADEATAGPTNCVIGAGFANAITQKMTVIDAVKSGNLPGAWPFGFNKQGEDKLSYNQGYPYRSILILRKYRVIPVGWELAAQEIQRQYSESLAKKSDAVLALATDLPNGISLNDLLACYNPVDDITGYYAEWCKGLIDPYWVLKIPDYYCKAKGYGPEIQGDVQQVASGTKYCSTDNGKNVSKIDGENKECSVDNDCCTEEEQNYLDSLRTKNDAKTLRIYKCNAKCSYSASKLMLQRNGNYCADEQQCIKTDKNGTCLFYGYCTEERRKWTFSRNSQDKVCQPYANTCTSYRDDKGRNKFFLANTLDFDECNANNVGCRQYATGGVYNSTADTVAWSEKPALDFNGQIENCSASDEGCHEFIRIKPGFGTNLIPDGDFENDDTARWSESGEIAVLGQNNAKVFAGTNSLYVAPNKRGIAYFASDLKLLVSGFSFDPDQTYTFSAMVYTVKGQAEMGIGKAKDSKSIQTVASDSLGKWENFVLTVDNTFNINIDTIYLKPVTSDTEFYVDNIQFNLGSEAPFIPYNSANLVYQKLLPGYMEASCYVRPPYDYTLKPDAPAKCQKFVRKCNKDEAGCELYTDIVSKDQIAGKVKDKDFCPGECVGYDTYVQKSNSFYSAREEHFIPATAKACRANAVGCAAFTNLDKLKQGGESIEYYSTLRNCIKPNDTCGEFYTWEGSTDTGIQVRVSSLKMNQITGAGFNQPATVDDTNQSDNSDSSDCNETIFGLSPDDPDYNPNCQQFTGKDLKISYHDITKTVSCSDSCFPYRLTLPNIEPLIDDSSSCLNANGHWDDGTNKCTICRGGGFWDSANNGCIYNGIPAESTSCSSVEAGCSQYGGNFANKVRVIFNDSFEANVNGWNYPDNTGVSISSEALIQGGHSVHSTGNFIRKSVKGQIKKGKKYELTFMAKTKNPNIGIDSIVIMDSQNISYPANHFVDGLKLSADWRLYKFAINEYPDDDGSSIDIRFTGDGINTFIDNIKLIEVDERYYLIKDSWNTPVSCDQDQRHNPSPLYMLGCRAYLDRSDKQTNIKSFSSLCQASGVGCEALIDTQNSHDYRSLVFNDGKDIIIKDGKATTTLKNGKCDSDEPSCVSVPEDQISYVVYDSAKSCFAQKKGCQRLGLASVENDNTFTDTYKINDPDRYLATLCRNQDIGCTSWLAEIGGQVYFKDPGNRVCEYRQQGNSQTYSWLKKKLSYCFSADKCTADSDCAGGLVCKKKTENAAESYCSSATACANGCPNSNLKCELSDIDSPCDPMDYLKTIGLGVVNEKVQPYGLTSRLQADGTRKSGYAGACQQSEAGCTEYVDPESRINFNFLSKFDLMTEPINNVDINPDTMYIIKAIAGKEASVDCSFSYTGADGQLKDGGSASGLAVLDSSNNLSVQPSGKFAISPNSIGLSEEFIIDSHLTLLATGDIKASIKNVTCKIANASDLKEAIVSYRLKQSIERERPTKVDFVKGAVLFNERSYSGGKIQPLSWHTAMTTTDGAMIANSLIPPGNNANQLMQVDADRECSKWLGCKSYGANPFGGRDKICFERGLCDQLNDAGECVNFLPTPQTKLTYDIANLNTDQLESFANMTGYIKAGYKDNLQSADMFHTAAIVEVGDTKVPFDGSFENVFDSGFQLYKTIGSSTPGFAPVIKDAAVMQTELGISSYLQTPDGQSIGKAGGSVIKDVDNAGGTDYVVSAYVFLRFGAKAELTVGRADSINNCPIKVNDAPACVSGANYAVLDSTSVSGRWVRLVKRFSIDYKIYNSGAGKDINKLRIGLNTDGLVYFDDIRLEPGLEVSDNSYLHSTCRIFPQSSSLSCDYYDDSKIRRKGWQGYCLETDPRNSSVCLMWYPLDKVEGEEFEEGAALSIPDDLYYCISAFDQCRADYPVEPEFYCATMIKVNKFKYWYTRINTGSDYILDTNIFKPSDGKLFLDFGVDTARKAGGTSTITIDQSIASGFYGAIITRKPLGAQQFTMGINGTATAKKPYPFLPYYGRSYNQNQPIDRSIQGLTLADPKYTAYCQGTVDQSFNDLPIEVQEGYGSGESNSQPLGVYDDCFVGIATQWADCGSDQKGLGVCCGSGYKYQNRDNGSACPNNETDHWTNLWNYLIVKSVNPLNIVKGAKTYIKYFANEGDWLGSGLDVECKVTGTATTTLMGYTKDTGNDGDEVSCFFDCFNHTNKYGVANSEDLAVKAVNRLFADLEPLEKDNPGCYYWNAKELSYQPCFSSSGSNYIWNVIGKNFQSINQASPTKQMASCPDTGRPKTTANDSDLCWVKPIAGNVVANLIKDKDKYILHGSGWVQITFTSAVDPDQLPLRKYVVGWEGDTGPSLTRTANMFDRRDPANPHIVQHFYDFNTLTNKSKTCSFIDSSGKTITGFEVLPKVRIEDNWDRYGEAVSTIPICVLQK